MYYKSPRKNCLLVKKLKVYSLDDKKKNKKILKKRIDMIILTFTFVYNDIFFISIFIFYFFRYILSYINYYLKLNMMFSKTN